MISLVLIRIRFYSSSFMQSRSSDVNKTMPFDTKTNTFPGRYITTHEILDGQFIIYLFIYYYYTIWHHSTLIKKYTNTLELKWKAYMSHEIPVPEIII